MREAIEPRTFSELVKRIKEVLPEASFDEDLEGQIVIYTNLFELNREGDLARFEQETVQSRE